MLIEDGAVGIEGGGRLVQIAAEGAGKLLVGIDVGADLGQLVVAGFGVVGVLAQQQALRRQQLQVAGRYWVEAPRAYLAAINTRGAIERHLAGPQ